MTDIQSPTVQVGLSPADLRVHLLDLRNFESLLPQSKVKDFVGSETSAQFTIQGGVNIELSRPENRTWTEDGTLLLDGGGAPFSFHLTVRVAESSDAGNVCSADVLCSADLNPFLKMMAQKPLDALFSYIVSSLSRQFPI